jgi:hypothetical protein
MRGRHHNYDGGLLTLEAGWFPAGAFLLVLLVQGASRLEDSGDG